MSVYKVPQDVEAEDKLLGPLTFKQLVILLIDGFLGFIMILLFRIHPLLIVPFMPVFLVLLFFGIYRRKDQSVETYVAALLRFYFKPRKRIWDKDGILETVIITAPKRITGPAVDHFTNAEVRNRLKTLGQLMDSRGWSAKNATLQDGTMAIEFSQSDRLVAPNSAQEPIDVHDSDDILNEYSSNSAQNIAQQTAALQQQAKSAAVQQMQQAATAQPPSTVADPTEEELKMHVQYQPGLKSMKQNMVKPLDEIEATEKSAPQSSSSVMTTDVPPDILELSRNNDRSVESIAKEADKILESGDTISLHGR